MPPDGLHDIIDRWHHPLVRDLAWLLLAPDLLDLRRPDPASLGLADDRALADFLDALQARPSALERCVGATLKGRMGHYHERLWQFLLATAPATQLLAHNLPVVRDHRTLGELDLVYRLRRDPAPVHLEVAIKYYLGLPEGPGAEDDQARWIGPGGLDSLALKRSHLERHQLPLAHSPDARAALAACLGHSPLPRLQQRLAMPGVLFYPLDHDLPPPRDASPAHLRGRWLHWRNWSALRAELPEGSRGAWLCKPHWLALPRAERLAPLAVLEHRLKTHFAAHGAPVQLALRLPGPPSPTQWCRLFVVTDDWPRQVPLPPA
ncbi:DUF1853 family protein [Halomonas nitroreducens]|uniref:DUF1853 family protein n=1 Tax=Halomonas nitroreducens TaxID=447425 RepID=A0A431UYS1_9GAMM|nr:DUF1853 family protein [Halomonas nitroreducens]RTQ98732.1 DUF1853 family protein [Halomonas nitroreducens]